MPSNWWVFFLPTKVKLDSFRNNIKSNSIILEMDNVISMRDIKSNSIIN